MYVAKYINVLPHIPRSYPHGRYRTPVLYFSQCDIWKFIVTLRITKKNLIGSAEKFAPRPKTEYKQTGIRDAV